MITKRVLKLWRRSSERPPEVCPSCGGTGTDPRPPRQPCARDSDWCDGVICRENGIDCPNADPPAFSTQQESER